MKTIEEYLKIIEIDEKIINHPALKGILEEYTFYFQNNYKININNNKIEILKSEELFPILIIRKNQNNLEIIEPSYIKTISLLEVSEELIETTKSIKNNEGISYIEESIYLDNGLEKSKTIDKKMEYCPGRFGYITVSRIEREQNGYIAKVFSREFANGEYELGDTINMNEIAGYLNLDIKTNKLFQQKGKSFSYSELEDRLSIKPHRLTEEDFYKYHLPHLTKEQKRYILDGIIYTSIEEERNWESIYPKGLIITQEINKTNKYRRKK